MPRGRGSPSASQPLGVYLLLPNCKVDPLQHIAALIPNLDMPRPLRVSGHALAAPRPPRRPADRQRNVAVMIAAVGRRVHHALPVLAPDALVAPDDPDADERDR